MLGMLLKTLALPLPLVEYMRVAVEETDVVIDGPLLSAAW
jgi:hypothetical protein